MSLPSLNALGLTSTESTLYELLLKLGEVPVADLITASDLKRPTVYKALYSLVKKGLVEQKEVKKKIHFRPESPSILLTQAEEKFQEINQARSILQTVMPTMLSDYTLSVERPVVHVYEGVEGLKKIYKDTLEEGKPLFSFLQTAEVDQILFSWLTTEYVTKRTEAKIHAKVIVASGDWSKTYTERDVEEYRTTKLVDSSRFPFQHEVIIYGAKVAFINYKKGEKLIGIIIHHPQITLTMKAVFDLAWE